MASRGYSLDRSSVEKIKADHLTLKRRLQHIESLFKSGLVGESKDSEIVVKTTEVIPGIDSNNKLGSGKAQIYELQQESSPSQDANGYYYYDYSYAESKREEIRVYNASAVPIATDSFIKCSRHHKTGLFVVEPVQTAVGQSNGISGRSGSTAGTGSASLYYISSGSLVDTGEDVTVYNIADSTVAAGSWITIKQNSSGLWVVDMEACG